MCNSRLLHLAVVLAAILFVRVLVEDRPAQAAPNALDPSGEKAVSLRGAVLEALEHNLDITISRHTKEARLTDILFEQAKFDPTLDFSARYDRTVNPVNQPIFGFSPGSVVTEPQTFDQNVEKFDVGLSQKLITGGDWDFTFNPQRTSIAGPTGFLFNPAYTSSLTLNLTQPLLRNFGTETNRTQILIAKNNAQVEEHEFLTNVLTVIASVQQTFWELVFANEGLKVAQIALKAAQQLEASNRAKAEAGVMTVVDVLQAQAAVAARQEEVLIAERAIGDQEDQLRQLLSPSESTLRRTVRLVPTDKPKTNLEPISLQEAIDVALEQRPEVLQAAKNIENSNLNVGFAKNQLLPSLNVEGTAGLNSLGKNPSDKLDRLFSGSFYQLGAGLVLSYPLGNRSAWSQYRKRRLEARNAQVSLQRTRQEVIINIREAVRGVRTDFKRIETTRSARILAQKQLRAETERLNLGLSTTRLVLEFQRDLAIARRNELRAIVDYNNSLSNLARQKGTTLQDYGIELR